VDGNTTAAALHMKDLFQAIHRTEPRNAALMLRVAQPIARTACGEAMLLNLTVQLLQTAVKQSSGALEYVQELARQHILAGDYRCVPPPPQALRRAGARVRSCESLLVSTQLHRGHRRALTAALGTSSSARSAHLVTRPRVGPRSS